MASLLKPKDFGAINYLEKKKYVASFVEFLNKETNIKDLSSVTKGNIYVAIKCLESAFNTKSENFVAITSTTVPTSNPLPLKGHTYGQTRSGPEIGEYSESFVHERKLVKYQSQSKLVKITLNQPVQALGG